jgi:DNA polymerase III subunit epsilon
MLILMVILVVAILAYRFLKPSTTSEVKPDFSALPSRFVVLDIETTGLDAAKHEIIEIGALKVSKDSINHPAICSLIKPTGKLPKKITELTGITMELLEEKGEPLEAAIKEFIEFAEDLPLVAFNAEFDMAFLQAAAKQHSLFISNKSICALKMARRAWPGRKSYKLSDLARDGGLSNENSHRALGDCKRALIIYTSAVSALGTSS